MNRTTRHLDHDEYRALVDSREADPNKADRQTALSAIRKEERAKSRFLRWLGAGVAATGAVLVLAPVFSGGEKATSKPNRIAGFSLKAPGPGHMKKYPVAYKVIIGENGNISDAVSAVAVAEGIDTVKDTQESIILNNLDNSIQDSIMNQTNSPTEGMVVNGTEFYLYPTSKIIHPEVLTAATDVTIEPVSTPKA